jgi:DNA-damage-inducible protein J
MGKTANINMRVEPRIKKGAERIFSNYGLTVTDAVNIFLHKALMVGGLPFAVHPDFNSETIKAMEDTEKGRNLPGPYKTAREAVIRY